MAINQAVINKPAAVKILEKVHETGKIATLKFALAGLHAAPGQFFMIWVPGVDEIPMSISSISNDLGLYEISVAAVGEATKALYAKDPGDIIGVRGPFGRGFDLEAGGGRPCVIGGGVGMAALMAAIQAMAKLGKDVVVINAARAEGDLLYHAQFKSNLIPGKTYFTSTDDGSCGEKCFGHELFLKLLEQGKLAVSSVYTCGPELMMRQLLVACNDRGLPIQASLERMMRCGSGLCGLCAMDPTGLLVCKDGPVFSGSTLGTLTEFGNYTRDFSGKKYLFKK